MRNLRMNAKAFVGYKKGELTMTRKKLDQARKAARRLNSNVSTVMNGLTAMNGNIRSIKHWYPFLKYTN